MMTRRILFIGVTAVIVAIQLIRPDRNTDRRQSEFDMARHYMMPDKVQAILRQSCYDCHSNNTNYPWYAEVQPISWWLNSHIRNGKEELNFSEFGSYTSRKQKSKLKAIKNSIADSTMPLPSYLIIHGKARLSELDKRAVAQWIDGITDSL